MVQAVLGLGLDQDHVYFLLHILHSITFYSVVNLIYCALQ